MVLVQGFGRQVKEHTADYTDHTCMDYSPLASASGNTCGEWEAYFTYKTLITLICKRHLINRYKTTCNHCKSFPSIFLFVQQNLW